MFLVRNHLVSHAGADVLYISTCWSSRFPIE